MSKERKVGDVFKILKIQGEDVPKDICAKIVKISNNKSNNAFWNEQFTIILFSYETGKELKRFTTSDVFFDTLKQEGNLIDLTQEELDYMFKKPVNISCRLASIGED